MVYYVVAGVSALLVLIGIVILVAAGRMARGYDGPRAHYTTVGTSVILIGLIIAACVGGASLSESADKREHEQKMYELEMTREAEANR